MSKAQSSEQKCKRGISGSARAATEHLKRDPSGRGFSHLGKDGVFRTMSKDYDVIDAKGLTPDEIKQFLAILPDEIRNTDEAKELANVDGSKVTSYQELFEPEEGILPKKPSEGERRQRREALEKQRGERMPKLG